MTTTTRRPLTPPRRVRGPGSRVVDPGALRHLVLGFMAGAQMSPKTLCEWTGVPPQKLNALLADLATPPLPDVLTLLDAMDRNTGTRRRGQQPPIRAAEVMMTVPEPAEAEAGRDPQAA